MSADPEAMLATWLPRIHDGNRHVRSGIGSVPYNALALAQHVLAFPRALTRAARGGRLPRPRLQAPWLPYWPALAARPLHDAADYPWAGLLRQASGDIRRELAEVCDSFERARYDSDFNAKPWNTYYFYLEGRAVPDHLAACPRTREVLEQIPHNGLHVCFSALEPGGSLHPHTGPTNASLTAHLGLVDCSGSTIWVGGQSAPYRDDDVVIFDDSFVHWVENTGTRRRYTLMITFWHPELTAPERALLRLAVRLGAR